MSIIRREPFSDLVSLRQAMDKLFDDSFVRPSRMLAAFSEEAVPAIDIYQTPNEFVVKASLPGTKPEDVDIDITGNTLTIKGETKAEQEIKKEDYLYQERRYGSFSRSLVLPSGLQADKTEATMENGILTLSPYPRLRRLSPKQSKLKPRRRNN